MKSQELQTVLYYDVSTVPASTCIVYMQSNFSFVWLPAASVHLCLFICFPVISSCAITDLLLKMLMSSHLSYGLFHKFHCYWVVQFLLVVFIVNQLMYGFSGFLFTTLSLLNFNVQSTHSVCTALHCTYGRTAKITIMHGHTNKIPTIKVSSPVSE